MRNWAFFTALKNGCPRAEFFSKANDCLHSSQTGITTNLAFSFSQPMKGSQHLAGVPVDEAELLVHAALLGRERGGPERDGLAAVGPAAEAVVPPAPGAVERVEHGVVEVVLRAEATTAVAGVVGAQEERVAAAAAPVEIHAVAAAAAALPPHVTVVRCAVVVVVGEVWNAPAAVAVRGEDVRARTDADLE